MKDRDYFTCRCPEDIKKVLWEKGWHARVPIDCAVTDGQIRATRKSLGLPEPEVEEKARVP